MQIRPMFVGLAVAIAAAGFFMAVMTTLIVQPSHHGLVPLFQHRSVQP